MELPDLNVIRGQLRQFETQIISALLRRAQFNENFSVYNKGNHGYQKYGLDMGLLDIMLHEDEKNKSRAGKFLQPEERPFTGNLPGLERNIDKFKSSIPTEMLSINLTDKVMSEYVKLIPSISRKGEDENNLGSTAEADIDCLNLISRRVHFGTFYVSERKFLDDKNAYIKLAKDNDEAGILRHLTNQQVEDQIYQRVLAKADYLQADARLERPRYSNIVEPEVIADFFRDIIIPLTKEGEVKYLMKRAKMYESMLVGEKL